MGSDARIGQHDGRSPVRELSILSQITQGMFKHDLFPLEYSRCARL